MRRVTGRLEWFIFGFSILALVLLGIAMNGATSRFSDNEKWVAHTREVETEIAQVGADLAATEAATLGYVFGSDESALNRFSSAQERLPQQARQLQTLTADNPVQQQKLAALIPLLDQRLSLLEQAIERHRTALHSRQPQRQAAVIAGPFLDRELLILREMREEEERLLTDREAASEQSYRRIRTVLGMAFAVVILLLFATIQSLMSEVKQRKTAEAAVRRLSGRILEVQDMERRKVARELHDSIGQYFSAFAMNLSLLTNPESPISPGKRDKILSDCLQLVQQGMAETRTLSHLLHPPLLDEAGFTSAAKWYVDGFTQRSRIKVELEIPENLPRMPREVELVLFRVLQESLTNIHKHSGSKSARVQLLVSDSEAVLRVQDFGKGLPASLIEEFENTGTGTGIGLAGMRERTREMGGVLTIQSRGAGVQLEACLPLQSARNQKIEPSGPLAEPGLRLHAEASDRPDLPGTHRMAFHAT